MSILEGLRFSRGDTVLHRMDPRIKFFMTFVIFTSAIIFFDIIPLIFIFILQIPLVLIGKIGREWIKTLRGGAFLAIIIFLTNLVAFYWFRGQITGENIEYSLALTLRFLTLITSFSVFFLTTSPDKLSLALETIHVPYEFNFAFITAIRFVPVLADQAQTIIDAQKSRGLELERGNIFTRIKKYIPVLLPLIINSIRRSLELAEAMESRAFGASERRTNLYELEIKKIDYIVLFLSILGLILIGYIKLFMPDFPDLIPPNIVFKL